MNVSYIRQKGIAERNIPSGQVGDMLNEYNLILLKSIVKLLEEKIDVIKNAERNDYNDGVIDGLLIAIKTIEN